MRIIEICLLMSAPLTDLKTAERVLHDNLAAERGTFIDTLHASHAFDHDRFDDLMDALARLHAAPPEAHLNGALFRLYDYLNVSITAHLDPADPLYLAHTDRDELLHLRQRLSDQVFALLNRD